jgi:hypothetical protein
MTPNSLIQAPDDGCYPNGPTHQLKGPMACDRDGSFVGPAVVWRGVMGRTYTFSILMQINDGQHDFRPYFDHIRSKYLQAYRAVSGEVICD